MTNEIYSIQSEHALKIHQLRQLMDDKRLDAIVLQRCSSMAWITCGADFHINTAATDGDATLLITPKDKLLFTTNIEAPRLENEEGLINQGWKFMVSPWYEDTFMLDKFISDNNMSVGCDGLLADGDDLTREITWMRSCLNENEVVRFKQLAAICAEGMDKAIRAVKPGMTEYQIAGLHSSAVESCGVQAIVNLVATDERIFNYRHPLPTDKKLDRYAMLILCGRKWGLICSLTRLVYFGKLIEEIDKKSKAVAQIDAEMIAATRPGYTLVDVLKQAEYGYEKMGFVNEWQKHHQGGLAGYETREITATPEINQPVLKNQVFTWNPSITGTKSEDTFLVGENGNQILTEIPGWPFIPIQVGNETIKRPAILIQDA